MKIFGKVQRLVAGINLRFISGQQLNRDPEWISTIIAYVVDVSRCDAYLKLFPDIFRPILFRMLPVRRRLAQTYIKANKIFDQAQKNIPEFESMSGASDEENFLNWARYKTKTDGTAIPHVNLQLSFGFAAIATTATALVSILHELAANPDLVEILRNEIEEVSPQGSDFLDGGNLSKLLKMDSLMKESQRIYPFSQG